MIKIFVDDMRVPLDDEWILASDVSEAKELISKGEEFMVSLDHDLGEKEGEEPTTRLLIAWCVKNGHIPVAAAVHSSNPVGAAWLEAALDRDFPNPIPRINAPEWGL